MSALKRVGKNTRFSLFVPLSSLTEAKTSGWAMHQSGSGEIIHIFEPHFLPGYAVMTHPAQRIAPLLSSLRLADYMPGDNNNTDAIQGVIRFAHQANFEHEVVRAYNRDILPLGKRVVIDHEIDGAQAG